MPTRDELLAAYALPDRTHPTVRMNFVQSADGAATLGGRSGRLGGETDRTLMQVLRAMADVIVVGAGTVRADDPSLTVRLPDGERGADDTEPERLVLGRAPEGAAIRPCTELDGDLGEILDALGERGILQLMVEGGASVAHAFHAAGLVDRYVVYLAPALFGGDDGASLFTGPGAPSIDDVWRGRIVSLRHLGDDLRLDLEGS